MTLAGEFVCPSKAFADCGNYVSYTNAADADRHHQDMPADGPKPVGCHGPNCHQQPPVPAAPSSPTKVRLANDRAAFQAISDPPASISDPFHTVSPDGRAVRRGTDVFHPPR